MSLARPTLARLAAASGGNPFFALEIGRALARAGDERAFDDPLPVPSALQELVASRLARPFGHGQGGCPRRCHAFAPDGRRGRGGGGSTRDGRRGAG